MSFITSTKRRSPDGQHVRQLPGDSWSTMIMWKMTMTMRRMRSIPIRSYRWWTSGSVSNQYPWRVEIVPHMVMHSYCYWRPRASHHFQWMTDRHYRDGPHHHHWLARRRRHSYLVHAGHVRHALVVWAHESVEREMTVVSTQPRWRRMLGMLEYGRAPHDQDRDWYRGLLVLSNEPYLWKVLCTWISRQYDLQKTFLLVVVVAVVAIFCVVSLVISSAVDAYRNDQTI